MQRTWMPTAVGILNVVSGAFLLIGGIAVIAALDTPMATSVASYVMYSMELSNAPDTSVVSTIIVILATVLIVPAIVSILGGICALKRGIWGLALAGSILSFFYLPFLGLPAIVLIALSKSTFE